jgi:hypothetical protein
MARSSSNSPQPKDDAASERALRTAAVRQRGFGHQPHAATAATRCGLHHHRIADACCLAGETLVGLVRPKIARQARHAAGLRDRLGRRLAPQRANRPDGWADPDEARIHHGLREIGVFALETIAGMDRVGARRTRGGNQLVDAQVALG